MLIKINKKTYEISNNLIKLSPYINSLFKLGRAIPLSSTTNEIFEIFKEWFEILDKLGINDNLYTNDKILIFYPNFFIQKTKDIATLIKIYELGIFNQIDLLVNTILFILARDYLENQTILPQLLENKVYFINLLSKKNYNGEISFKYDESDLTGIEFENIKNIKNKVIINYHPYIFDKNKFVYNSKQFDNLKETLKILKLSESSLNEIEQKIEMVKENYLKNFNNHDVIFSDSCYGCCGYCDDCDNKIDNDCKIITIYQKISDIINNQQTQKQQNIIINDSNITEKEINYFIELRQQTQERPQEMKDVYEIEDNKKYIKEYAFENLHFEKIILPNCLSYIGTCAFKNCGKFSLCFKDKQGKIRENMISGDIIIKDDAFYGCELPEVLQEQIKKINPKAFDADNEFNW